MGVRLVSFAVHWIKAEMHEFILRNWRIVKIATTKAQRKLFFNLRSRKKKLSWMTNEEVAAVAEDLGVDVKTVRQMEGRLASTDTAFDAPVSEDEDSSYLSPSAYLEDHSADPAVQLEEANWEEDSQRRLLSAMNALDERSRDILARRWLADEKATLHELAAEYSVSAERIRQLEKNAMKKIRGAMLEA
jgi:RNA polymerase sigma-32 factor